jgi:membrane fusion protein (multidrug efflux system)
MHNILGSKLTDESFDPGTAKAVDSRQWGARPMTRKRLAAVCALLASALSLWFALSYPVQQESTDDAQVDGHVVPISAEIAGRIRSVLVSDNQEVHSGDQLMEIDPSGARIALQQAKVALATAEAVQTEAYANLQLVEIRLTNQLEASHLQTEQARAAARAAAEVLNGSHAQRKSAEAFLRQQQTNYRKALRDSSLVGQLVASGIVSRRDYEAATEALDLATAQVDGARAALEAADRNINQSQAQLSEAEEKIGSAILQERLSDDLRRVEKTIAESRHRAASAQAQSSEADVASASLNLGYTTVRAPIHGIVSHKLAESGMFVSRGQKLMYVIPLDQVWITANFKETQLRHLKINQQVRLLVDAYGKSRVYKAHIESIAATSGDRFSSLPVENATGNYVKVVQRVPVKIVLETGENRDHALRPGMSVVPTVLVRSNER